MSLFYDFNGNRHEIQHSEIDAIERSGPAHRWQDYADGKHGRGYFDVTVATLAASRDAIINRPGQTEPGTMPIHKPNGSTALDAFYRSAFRPIHWLLSRPVGRGRFRACDKSATTAQPSAGFPSAQFRAAAHSARACPRCVDLFNEHNR